MRTLFTKATKPLLMIMPLLLLAPLCVRSHDPSLRNNCR